MPSTTLTFRYSGHETFVCRYAWLPKVIRELAKTPALLKDDAVAMVALGVGKNMVRSIRFWAETAQVIAPADGGDYCITDFGKLVLGTEGYDPFLENPRTLWLLHWKIATHPTAPLFFWHQLLNYWHRAEFSESEIIPFFRKNTPAGANLRSDSTLAAGYHVFVNTYVATQGRKGEIAEDSLDSPLVELDLVRRIGDRRAVDTGPREPIYAFNLDDKPGVTSALFAYSLHDYWAYSPFSQDDYLPFCAITAAPGSPGQTFKLPEFAVRRHLDALRNKTSGAYAFEESASLQQAHRKKGISAEALLDAVYRIEE